MLTLALDTTAEFGSIALLDDNTTIDEILVHAPDGYSGLLFERIETVLNRNDIRLADIDLFGGASGPGSFTGVRVGLAAIKGLAEVLGKPALAVSNLQALAEFGAGNVRAPLIDARRGEVYAALFDSSGTAIVPESVLPFPSFLELVGGRQFEWISSNFDPFAPALVGTRFEHDPVVRAPRALAAAVGRIARRRIAAGTFAGPESVEANYVRRSDAELLWKQ